MRNHLLILSGLQSIDLDEFSWFYEYGLIFVDIFRNLRELRTRSESEMYESCVRRVVLNVVDFLLCFDPFNWLVLVAPDYCP